MFYPAFVFLFVCLLRACHVTYVKTRLDLRENLTTNVSLDKENLLNFESHPHLHPDLVIFWKILQQCDREGAAFLTAITMIIIIKYFC